MKHLLREVLLRLGLLGYVATVYCAARPRTIYHNLPYWLKGAPDRLPIPPLRLRSLVWREYADLRTFFEEEHRVDRMLDILDRTGSETQAFRAILDFGCGAGRAVRQFASLKRRLAHAMIYGSDINPKQIDWCRRNFPFARFDLNQAYPPVAYRSETFDLIYTFSVFTHLSESQQCAWIDELARLLRPGGYLVLTTCGESYFETLTEQEKREFRDKQLVVRHDEQAGVPSTYAECIVFHPQTYVQRNLMRGFDLIHFSPGIPSANGPKSELDYYYLRKQAL